MSGHRLGHVITALCLAATWGCGDEVESSRGPLSDDDIPEELSTIAVTGGFLNGQRVEFYQLGEVEVRANRNGQPADAQVHPLYVFGRDDSWQFATADSDGSQPHAIIDSIPGQAGYTGFWEIHQVVVAAGFDSDIKSQAALQRAGYEIVPTGEVVNCPVIPHDADIEAPALGADVERPVLRLWYRRFETRCLLLDGGQALLSGGAPRFSVATVPVGERLFPSVPIHEVFIPRLSLFDQRLDVPGNIIATAELGEDSTYSPLVRVFDIGVPPDYDFCAFDALEDVDASLIETRDPLTFWNLSMLGVDQTVGCSE